MVRKIFIAVVVIAVAGSLTGIYLWNKPHKKVEDAPSIAISAVDLHKAFAANEADANGKYLKKALEVSGTVAEVDKNQDGGTMVVLQTDDVMAGVQCTMRDKNINVEKGKAVTIKGFCSDNGIMGIILTDCVMK